MYGQYLLRFPGYSFHECFEKFEKDNTMIVWDVLAWRNREDGNWGAAITYFCLYSDLSLSFVHTSVKIQLSNFYVDLIRALLCGGTQIFSSALNFSLSLG